MLYKNSLVNTGKTDFLFDAQPYNEDIDIKEIAAIQVFLEKHGYIPEAYIPKFLNWLVYSARMNVSNPLDDVMESSFAGKCAVAQSFFDQILEKFGLDKMTFNVGGVLGTDPIHALTCVQIPTMVNGQETNKLFMLDPTFRQFCISEENRYERYNEEKRWGVRMATPHPGYFFNLTDEGRNFAQGLIHYGYFEINEDSLKTYFDPFALYVTPKEAYENQNDVGMISSTTATGTDYWERMVTCREKPLRGSYGFDLETPKESIERENNKLRNRISRLFHRQELNDMFEIVDDTANVNSNNSKK